MVRSPRPAKSTTPRMERPIRRWISTVRPSGRPRATSRWLRSPVDAGSIEYSAVTHPRPWPFIQRGTSLTAEAVQITRVPPAEMSADPVAVRTKPGSIATGLSSAAARPSDRSTWPSSAAAGTTACSQRRCRASLSLSLPLLAQRIGPAHTASSVLGPQLPALRIEHLCRRGRQRIQHLESVGRDLVPRAALAARVDPLVEIEPPGHRDAHSAPQLIRELARPKPGGDHVHVDHAGLGDPGRADPRDRHPHRALHVTRQERAHGGALHETADQVHAVHPPAVRAGSGTPRENRPGGCGSRSIAGPAALPFGAPARGPATRSGGLCPRGGGSAGLPGARRRQNWTFRTASLILPMIASPRSLPCPVRNPLRAATTPAMTRATSSMSATYSTVPWPPGDESRSRARSAVTCAHAIGRCIGASLGRLSLGQ